MFKGKALLVIRRDEDSRMCWDIQPFVQSINKDDDGGEVDEAFSFIMRYGYHPPPAAAWKMAVGETIRVAVSFQLHFTRSWEGEYDSEMYLTKERVLRRQLCDDKQYRKKFYKYWKKAQQGEPVPF